MPSDRPWQERCVDPQSFAYYPEHERHVWHAADQLDFVEAEYLSLLSPEQLEIVLYRFWDQFTWPEIADMMGNLSKGQMERRWSAIQTKLMNAMSEDERLSERFETSIDELW